MLLSVAGALFGIVGSLRRDGSVEWLPGNDHAVSIRCTP